MVTENVVPRIVWKGSRDAVERMSAGELGDYIGKLRKAMESVGRHFSYMDTGSSMEKRPGLGSKVIFSGALDEIGKDLTDAVLLMYRVNSTPFRPVPLLKATGECLNTLKGGQ